jgi:hypothetical protein
MMGHVCRGGGDYRHLYVSIAVIIIIIINNIVLITHITMKVSLLHNVQTGSRIRPASHTMETGNKAAGDLKFTILLHLKPNLMMVELYLHSPIYFYGTGRN